MPAGMRSLGPRGFLTEEALLASSNLIEEHVLAENFTSEAMPKIERIHSDFEKTLGSKNAILIFLDAKEENSPIKVLKYSFLVDDTWTSPITRASPARNILSRPTAR